MCPFCSCLNVISRIILGVGWANERRGVTMWCLLSLAKPIPRMILAYDGYVRLPLVQVTRPLVDLFLPEASFGLWVLSLPASVCASVCQSVCQSLACPRDNSGPVQVRITKFGPQVQNNLVPIFLWSDRLWSSRSNIRSKSKFTPFWACPQNNSSLATPHPFKLGSPNLDQRCKIHGLRSL